jgi:hypothetical protein
MRLIIVRISEYLLVVAILLVLRSNGDSNLGCVFEVAESSVQLVGPKRLFWNIVNFAHKVVLEHLDEVILLTPDYKVNHFLDEVLSCLLVKFKCFLRLLSLVVMESSY